MSRKHKKMIEFGDYKGYLIQVRKHRNAYYGQVYSDPESTYSKGKRFLTETDAHRNYLDAVDSAMNKIHALIEDKPLTITI